MFPTVIILQACHLYKVNLPSWCVVLEVVVRPLEEHPVEVVEGVLEAPDVSEPRRVVGWVLMDIHYPTSATGE